MNDRDKTNGMCPACDGSPSSTFDAGSFTYVVCGSCNSGWLNPAPDDTASLYGSDYFDGAAFDGYSDYAADADLHRANAADRLNAIREITQRQPILLDVGCAFGYGLDAGRDSGWLVAGVEVSDHARTIAQRSGHEVVSVITDVPAGRAADLVIFAQVLEHMPAPLAALKAAHERMAEGGTVLVETWNRDSRVARIMGKRWQQISPPSVLHLFTETGLHTLLGRAGFSEVAIEPWKKRVSIATMLGIVGGKAPSFLGSSLGSLAKSDAVGRRSFTYRLSDLVLARGVRRTTPQQRNSSDAAKSVRKTSTTQIPMGTRPGAAVVRPPPDGPKLMALRREPTSTRLSEPYANPKSSGLSCDRVTSTTPKRRYRKASIRGRVVWAASLDLSILRSIGLPTLNPMPARTGRRVLDY